MSIQELLALCEEMADHLQAALTAVEAALLTGSTGPLPAARSETMAAWAALEAAVAAAGRDNAQIG